jgi:high-affinity iron transporter
MRCWFDRRWAIAAWASAAISLAGVVLLAQSGADLIAATNAAGWQIPPSAITEAPPRTALSSKDVKKGQELFASNCSKCHGAAGHGDGKYGDPDHPPADLTQSTTPDGVMFYKVWNGRKTPAMPSFKSTMAKDDVWLVVEYAKSLRDPGAR